MSSRRLFRVPAPLVAVANWLLPGAGYLLIGQIARGLTIGLTILGIFVLGILIGGVHVVDPPAGVWNYWYLLLLPLCLGVAVVYKSIKCPSMSQVPREAAVIFLSILAGLLAAAGALFLLVRVVVG